VRIDARQSFVALAIAGLAGAALLLPAITWVGNVLSPSPLVPVQADVPPLLADAIWARALGGTATELRPLEPFGVARMVSCHLLAERLDDQSARDRQHDECMKLMPAVQAAAYLSTVQMRSDGVWQTPRVPFIQIAMVNQVTNTWTRAQLIASLAARGEYVLGWRGVEQASRGFFNASAKGLSLPQAAVIAALLGNTRLDPWCAPAAAAEARRRLLERMRDNHAIDTAAYVAANAAAFALADPPANHGGCDR
jgi:hypothetical protein